MHYRLMYNYLIIELFIMKVFALVILKSVFVFNKLAENRIEIMKL